jgi:hypothetical protein
MTKKFLLKENIQKATGKNTRNLMGHKRVFSKWPEPQNNI